MVSPGYKLRTSQKTSQKVSSATSDRSEANRVRGGLPLDGDQAPPTLAERPGAGPPADGTWGGGGLEGEEPGQRLRWPGSPAPSRGARTLDREAKGGSFEPKPLGELTASWVGAILSTSFCGAPVSASVVAQECVQSHLRPSETPRRCHLPLRREGDAQCFDGCSRDARRNLLLEGMQPRQTPPLVARASRSDPGPPCRAQLPSVQQWGLHSPDFPDQGTSRRYRSRTSLIDLIR